MKTYFIDGWNEADGTEVSGDIHINNCEDIETWLSNTDLNVDFRLKSNFNFTKSTYARSELTKLCLKDGVHKIKVFDEFSHETKVMNLDSETIETLREFLDGVEKNIREVL